MERQAAKAQTNNSNSTDIEQRLLSTIAMHNSQHAGSESLPASGNAQPGHKRQLILDTIEDLKRSLEDQKVELYGLNEDE